jgi:PAS domain S-box-containing protein
VTGLRPSLAVSARALLDFALGAFLVVLWTTGSPTVWLLLAFIAVASRAFLRNDGRSALLRATIVTVIGGGFMIHLWSNGVLPRSDVIEIPLIATLAYLFAGFATWRSRAERLVIRDRERLALLIDALPLATIAFDGDARVVTWNRSAESLFGWSAEEAFGKPNPIVPAGEKAGSDELHQRILHGETLKDVEVERQAADGTVLELGIFTSPLDAEIGPSSGFLVMYEDISQRKRAQRDRDEAQSRYRDLIEALPLVSYIDLIDEDTTNVYTSPQVAELLGWDLSDWDDRHFFQTLVHPDDFERVMGGAVDPNANGGEFAHEYRLRHASGDYVWVRDHSRIVEGVDGEALARGFLLDITKQKQLEEQLLQTQKMDALGQFAGGIAHDFNNLMTAISGYAELASGSEHSKPELTRWLGGIKAASAEATSLTSQLLSFTRHNVIEPRLVDLNDVARDAAGLLDRLVRDDVVVQLELAEPLSAVLGDLTQLKQVVLNLALNARDAMVDGGMLTIQTAAIGDSVVLRVSDTGCGMTPATKSRAFEPFFTTKAEGAGTGLGLAVAYGVIDSLGGTLSISSRTGEGTTVEAILPVASGEPVLVDVAAPVDAPRSRGGERVLVVEDRDVVRYLTQDVLEAAGFEVAAASGGREALEIVERSAPFDLLLTDVVMPGLSGPELSARLRERATGLTVLYMSGYTDDVLDPSELADPTTGFLRKPFSNAELVSRARELLDAASTSPAELAAAVSL